MSKKILNVATFGIAGGLLSKKKKAAEPAAAAATSKKGPIITQLGKAADALPPSLRRRVGGIGTILSDKLGS